jgi:hypothetical protein
MPAFALEPLHRRRSYRRSNPRTSNPSSEPPPPSRIAENRPTTVSGGSAPSSGLHAGDGPTDGPAGGRASPSSEPPSPPRSAENRPTSRGDREDERRCGALRSSGRARCSCSIGSGLDAGHGHMPLDSVRRGADRGVVCPTALRAPFSEVMQGAAAGGHASRRDNEATHPHCRTVKSACSFRRTIAVAQR